MKYYTVVGYWPDNNQPCVDWAKGTTPLAAAKKIMRKKKIRVVEVFKGRQCGILGNETLLPA